MNQFATEIGNVTDITDLFRFIKEKTKREVNVASLAYYVSDVETGLKYKSILVKPFPVDEEYTTVAYCVNPSTVFSANEIVLIVYSDKDFIANIKSTETAPISSNNSELHSLSNAIAIKLISSSTIDYEQLENLPKINSITLIGNKSASDLGFATVATSGSYTDLSNKPTIPTSADFVDLTSNQTVAGTKTFTTRPILYVESGLPTGYTKLDYVQTTGSQWINTGKLGHANWHYEIDFQQTSTSNYRLWGVCNQSSYVGYNLSLTYASNTWVTRFNFNSSGQQMVTLATIDVNRHTFKLLNGYSYFDNLNKGTTESYNPNYVFDYNTFLGTINPGGTTTSYNAHAYFYSYKVWDENNELIQNFIPAKNSSGVVGMYDTVENIFYTSASSTPLIAGTYASVNSPMATQSEIPTIPTNVSAFANDAGYLTSSTLPSIGSLNTDNSTAQTVSSSEKFTTNISLHKISKTGNYTDLLNKPTIPTTTSELTNDSGYITNSTAQIAESQVTNLPSDLQTIREQISGLKETYVVSSETNPAFDSQNDTILIPTSITDISGNIISVDTLKIGDSIYVKELSVPDRWVMSKSILPSGYDQLNYIQSTGTQYINTGYNQVYGTKIAFEIDIYIDAATGYFGGNGFTQTYLGNKTAGERHTYKTVYDTSGMTTYYTDGTRTATASWGTSTAYNNIPITLFALGMSASSVSNYCKVKLYSAKVWENDILVGEYIPCTQISTAKIGLYDLISSSFVSSDNALVGGTTQNGATLSKLETAKVPIASISKNGTTITPVNNNVDIVVPTKTSDITNDSGFLTESTMPKEIFYATYGTTTYAEITAALDANKYVVAVNGYYRCPYYRQDSSGNYLFGLPGYSQNSVTIYSQQRYQLTAANVWSISTATLQGASGLVTSISSSSDDSHYPSAKSVYDNLQLKQDELTFDNTPTQDSANPVKSSGIYNSIEEVREIAEGKTSNYAVSTAVNPSFTSLENTITVESFTEVSGVTYTPDDVKIGDNVYVIETEIPDRWVSGFVTGQVPTGYTQLAYLGSTGSQYINTTVALPTSGKFIIRNKINSLTTSGNCSFGALASGSNRGLHDLTTGSSTLTVYIGTGSVSISNYVNDNWHTLEITWTTSNGSGSGTYKIDDGTAVNVNISNFDSTTTLALFCRHLGSGFVNGATCYISKCEIYNYTDGTYTLRNKYIPCYNSSGVEGMYDYVNDVFYSNGGADTFIRGEELTRTGIYLSKLETVKVPITSISKNGTTITPINNNVDIIVPTTTSELTNNSGFITNAVNNLTNYSTTTAMNDAISAYHDISKQDKITSANKLDYSLLSNTPTIPTVNDATLTIQRNSTTIDTFTANSSTDKTINITVPTNADYVDLTSAQSVGGIKTFTANRMYVSGETHFTSGGSPTDYAYGFAVGIYGNKMMCNQLFVPSFKYRTSAMASAGTGATTWNLPNLTSGNIYTLATTTDIPTVNNGKLTMQINGTEKVAFTANQSTDTTFNVTAADLGLSQALVFKGITTTDLTDGSTTSPITMKDGSTLTPEVGNVVLTDTTVVTLPSTEFVWADSKWNKLGDAKSYVIKGTVSTAATPGTDSQGAHTHTVSVPTVSDTSSKLVTTTLSKSTASKASASTAKSFITSLSGGQAFTATYDESTKTMSLTPITVNTDSITPYTFSDVNVASISADTTVATGSVDVDGAGAEIVTEIIVGTTSATTNSNGSHTHTVNSHTHTVN